MAEPDCPNKPTTGFPQALNPSPQAGQPSKLSYMQRPPTILPNYGQRWRHGRGLKTSLPRVLLYDNVTQQTILEGQVSYIQSQRRKSKRHLEMNIKSFLLRKERKEKALLKLTKVQHGHDYGHFELEYYGRGFGTDKKIPEPRNERPTFFITHLDEDHSRHGTRKPRSILRPTMEINHYGHYDYIRTSKTVAKQPVVRDEQKKKIEEQKGE